MDTALTLLDGVIADAADALVARQAVDGHWIFELEADATIAAEFILLNHFLDEIDDPLEAKVAAYLRNIQGAHGGWPLFHGGAADISATVKAYYALKLAGDSPDCPHMQKARKVVLEHGGASQVNVFTRITLALFGQMHWRNTPVIRAEAVLLPEWSPFHLSKVSYWSRTVMVPLMVLATRKAQARNPRGIGIGELFADPKDRDITPLANATGSFPGRALIMLDRAAQWAEPLFPAGAETRAIAQAMDFVGQRLNGEHGLGAIFPAMANALMAMDVLGMARDHPDRQAARRAIDALVVETKHSAYCQPCLSPVWDTALAAHALIEAGRPGDGPALAQAGDWLAERQILACDGDWITRRPGTRPGGWAFQYSNDHYPDVDDTAVVATALDRINRHRHHATIDRAAAWVIAMQSANGGWGAFDADNTHHYLNHIPFADHGALLDPPSADVSGRCLGFLAQLGLDPRDKPLRRAVDYLWAEQEENGSWFGRWGTNYIYGSWSVIAPLRAAGIAAHDPRIARAAAWIKARQRLDGGWGEDCRSYWPGQENCPAPVSTPSQTAWAVLALMAAGETHSGAVRRGIDWLLQAPRYNGRWLEDHFNAVGFPRVFYLRYHGYSHYFPLWALSRYRTLTRGIPQAPEPGL